MMDTAVLIGLLGILTGCAVVLTATMVITAREARRTMREARQFFIRANRIARRADAAVAHCVGALAGTLAWFGSWKQRAQALWTGWIGNGAPRQRDLSGRRSHRVSSRLTGG